MNELFLTSSVLVNVKYVKTQYTLITVVNSQQLHANLLKT